MSGSVEASRKHGPFDTRWPSARRPPGPIGSTDRAATAPLPRATEVGEALDWDTFFTRHFRGRRRHDLEALSAYAAYKHGREWRSGDRPRRPTLRLVPKDADAPAIEAESEVTGAQRLLAAVAAVQTWEGEGGYSPEWTES